MKKASHKITLFTAMPRQSWYWVGIGIFFSLLIHVISITELPGHRDNPLLPAPKQRTEREQVKVNIVQKPKKPEKKVAEHDAQKILETPLAPTEVPKAPSRLGAQDHIAEKETRISNNIPRPKAADPGLMGKDIRTQKQQPAKPKQQEKAETSPPQALTMTPNRVAPDLKSDRKSLTSPDGRVVLPDSSPRAQPRNTYEQLMPTQKEMSNQVAVGYQDFVDDEVDVGERVDMNTTNFRFLGYFTNIRKAFEMVWTYPADAVRRGLQGEVKVEFTIQKSGTVSRIRVVDTSGHKILDEAVVEAIKLAQPFAPLPPGFQKDKLTVVGSFRYVLTNYAGAM
jgi:protein TonB